ncbi:hypothetical protein B0J17DRAFT_675030 [Rhizoctonia solani]|nr:hypothetical protein B0J17DRAFT_675030 [Rhizoctonia solani]
MLWDYSYGALTQLYAVTHPHALELNSKASPSFSFFFRDWAEVSLVPCPLGSVRSCSTRHGKYRSGS